MVRPLVAQADPPDLCGACGAYWWCEHRTPTGEAVTAGWRMLGGRAVYTPPAHNVYEEMVQVLLDAAFITLAGLRLLDDDESGPAPTSPPDRAWVNRPVAAEERARSPPAHLHDHSILF